MPTSKLVIIIAAAVVFAIYRQVTPQQVRRLPFIIFPLIAAYEAYRSLPFPIPPSQLPEVSLTIVAALAAGSVLAFTTRVYFQGDRLYLRGGWITLAAWAGMVIARVFIHVLFEGSFAYSAQTAWIIWADIAVAFGFRSLILYMKHPEIAQALAGQQGRGQGRA